MTKLQHYAETIQTVYGDNIIVDYDEDFDFVEIENPNDQWWSLSVGLKTENQYTIRVLVDGENESIETVTGYDAMYNTIMEELDFAGIEYEAV